jgi:endogenous inhibitor of DNA gyrase (YacG/DUF329 family)
LECRARSKSRVARPALFKVWLWKPTSWSETADRCQRSPFCSLEGSRCRPVDLFTWYVSSFSRLEPDSLKFLVVFRISKMGYVQSFSNVYLGSSKAISEQTISDAQGTVPTGLIIPISGDGSKKHHVAPYNMTKSSFAEMVRFCSLVSSLLDRNRWTIDVTFVLKVSSLSSIFKRKVDTRHAI